MTDITDKELREWQALCDGGHCAALNGTVSGWHRIARTAMPRLIAEVEKLRVERTSVEWWKAQYKQLSDMRDRLIAEVKRLREANKKFRGEESANWQRMDEYKVEIEKLCAEAERLKKLAYTGNDDDPDVTWKSIYETSGDDYNHLTGENKQLREENARRRDGLLRIELDAYRHCADAPSVCSECDWCRIAENARDAL